MKRILAPILSLLFVFGVMAFSSPITYAEEPMTPLSYPTDSPVLDSDLDGLTDTGETMLFQTDPKNPDSDSDGWYDGTEILAKTDPLDSTSPSATTLITPNPSSTQTPWVWYVTRASGLTAFVFAWLTIFLGIAIRLPGLKNIIRPVYSLSIHYTLAVQTLFFAFLHGISFLFDPFKLPTLADAFIPFHISPDKLDPFSLALGIMAFYGFIILVFTSWIKPMISQRVWRITHFLNIFVYATVVAHALFLGTDMKIPLYRNIFISINIFLVTILLLNFILKFSNILSRTTQQLPSSSPPDSSNPNMRIL